MRRPSIPPFDTYREYFTKNWLEWFDSLDNDIKQTRLLLKSYIAHASLAHNDLTGIQGGTTNEYYHLTLADHTEAVSFLNGGTGTHTQFDDHIADTTIHFEQADIDHTAINNIGVYTHPYLDIKADELDVHVADDDIHKLVFDEVEPTYTAGKETATVYSLANVAVKNLSYTYDTSGRVATISNGVNTWTFTHNGKGELTGALKT